MPDYSIRLELNKNTDGKIYDKLHAAMAEKGFTRYVIGDDGKKYQLPHGTYWKVSDSTKGAVFAEALTAAEKVWHDVDLVVTLSAEKALKLKPYVEPKPSAAILAGVKVNVPPKFPGKL